MLYLRRFYKNTLNKQLNIQLNNSPLRFYHRNAFARLNFSTPGLLFRKERKKASCYHRSEIKYDALLLLKKMSCDRMR